MAKELNEVVADGTTFRVGDMVRRAGRGQRLWKIAGLEPVAPPETHPWAEFTPVSMDGRRDFRRNAFSGPLKGYTLATQPGA